MSIETTPINATGTYPLNGGRACKHSEGTVVVINPNGSHTYTVGVYAEDGTTFVPYSDGLFTTELHVRHGRGALLGITVGGTVGGSDNLLVAYSG